jgi:hypothetical protein
LQPGVRRDVDDVPAPLEQVRDGGLGEEEACVEVHGHHAAVLLACHVGRVRREVDAGDVAQDVDVPEVGDASADDVGTGVGVAEIRVLHAHRSRRGVARLLETCGVDVDGVHGCAFVGEPQRDAPTDAGSCARDERDLAGEPRGAGHRRQPYDLADG